MITLKEYQKEKELSIEEYQRLLATTNTIGSQYHGGIVAGTTQVIFNERISAQIEYINVT